MKNQMNNQKGFTLIELIIVIVILGILAVTAAPRFIDLQNDARASTLEGVKGALQGSVQLVYAKAAIAGVQREATNNTVDMGTGTISTVYGYPAAATVAADIAKYLDLSTSDFAVAAGTGADAGTFTIRLSNDSTNTTCQVLYTDSAAAGSAPLISVTSTGC